MGKLVRGVAAAVGAARESYLTSKESRESGKGAMVESSTTELDASPTGSPGVSPEIKDTNGLSRDMAAVDLKHGNLQSTQPRNADPQDDVKPDRLEKTDTQEEEALPVYGSWELDEAQEEIAESQPQVIQSKVVTSAFVPQKEIPLLAEKFASTYPLLQEVALPPLNCSVIIPQRRPDSRKRGFIRAYAPVLEIKGISEDVFLDFIATFNVASQANPLLQAINLASFSALALPPGIGIAVSEAIRLAVDVGVEVHSRYRTNDFLDKINKLWFLPRGLLCFPMIWKPSVSSIITSVAIDTAAAEQSDGFDVDKKTIDKFKGSAGTSRGNVSFPDAAPLTFPILDDCADSTDEKSRTIKAKLAETMRTAHDYFDRRAQAKYAMTNPHSGLSHLGVRPEFKSRYSDPSHPAASGSLLGLITGGAISTGNRRLRRRQNQRGGITSPLAPGAVIGNSFFNNSGTQVNATAVADFMRDIRLSNVIRTMRGKVGDTFVYIWHARRPN